MQDTNTKPAADWQPMITPTQFLDAYDTLKLTPIGEGWGLDVLLRMVARVAIEALVVNTPEKAARSLKSVEQWAADARRLIAEQQPAPAKRHEWCIGGCGDDGRCPHDPVCGN